MVEYKCNRCHKIFNRKSNYQYHIDRKNKCPVIENNIPKYPKTVLTPQLDLNKYPKISRNL